MTHRLGIVIGAVVIVSALGCTETEQRAQRAEGDEMIADVVAARDAVWRAWFGNDQVVLQRMLPPEFVGIGWGGGAWDSRDTALRGATEFAKAGGSLKRLEFSDDKTQVFGDVVTMFSNYLVELETNGKVTSQRGRATEVFVRRNGVWTNPAWHLDSGR
jgi:Domain of unknown function (DUF4440)